MGFTLRFSLNRQGIRDGLPAHGYLVLQDDCGNAVGDPAPRPLFSIAGARAYVEKQATSGLFEPDHVERFEKDLTGSGLPVELTRYDRMVTALGASDDVMRVIKRFAGLLEPDQMPSAARFEVCTGGALCGFDHCDKYARHGALFIQNIPDPALISFSVESVMAVLKDDTERGIFTTDDRMRVGQQIEVAGLAPKEGRSDRIALSGIRGLEKLLDIAFGIYAPEKPARFEPCGTGDDRHFHFYVFDEKRYSPDAFVSQTQAEECLTHAVGMGAISEEDHARISTEYDAIGMPKASPHVVDLLTLLEEIKDTLTRSQNT